MTSKERVKLALAHKEPDRVPVGEFAVDYKIIEQILGRETFLRAKTKYTKALWAGRRDEVVECMKKDTVEFTLKAGLDMVSVGLVPGKEQKFDVPKQIDESTWEDRAGNILRYSDATEDIMVLEEGNKPVPPEVRKEFAPDPNDESRWELLKYVVEKLGKTHYVFARAGGDAIGFGSALGIQRQWLSLADNPEAHAKSRINGAKGFGQRLKRYMDEGCDALFLGEDYGHNLGPFMSPKQFREVFFPALKIQCEEIKSIGSPMLYHSCGNNRLILDQMVEGGIDLYQAIQTVEKIDEIKKLYGDKITLMGGVDSDTLCRGTVEDVRREARFAIKHCAPGGGFILASSHSIMIACKYDNFMAMIDMAYTEGRYPIGL